MENLKYMPFLNLVLISIIFLICCYSMKEGYHHNLFDMFDKDLEYRQDCPMRDDLKPLNPQRTIGEFANYSDPKLYAEDNNKVFKKPYKYQHKLYNYSCNYKHNNNKRLNESLGEDTIESHKEYAKNIPKTSKDPDKHSIISHDTTGRGYTTNAFTFHNKYSKFYNSS